MRGKLIDFRVFLAFDGITPADAGKTASCLTDFFDVKDHPRGCGENVQAEQTAPYDIGSPPRMRGKPRVLVRAVGQRGITPADAGKTQQPPQVGGFA